MSNVYIKTKIRSGNYAMEYLRKIRKKRILVVCDKFLAESGAINYILDSLDSSNSVELFDQAIPDPTIEIVGKGLGVLCRVRPDIVIGFGGGSAIDTAKAMIYFAGVRELVPKPRFVTIPTTSGTGSEVTSAAVITDSETKSKHLISSEDILADVAILDPRLTLSVPPAITANTGMDVLTHALEAYVANGCNVHEASTLAGMAFNTAGLGLNHSIAHQLGGTFHIPHGLANAMLLNKVIEYNSVNHDIMNKYATLAYKVQLVGMNEAPEMAVKTLEELIRSLMCCMDMPASIRELGISREAYEGQLQNMTDNALMDNCLISNPREAGTEAIKEILLSIY